jgi:transcriptional regulator with XRE-family HTH domain
MEQEALNRLIGARLRRRRRLLGLTQGDVGRGCGVSFQQIQKYENAVVSISAGMLWKLTRALSVDMGYIFEGVGKRQPEPEGEGAVRD